MSTKLVLAFSILTFAVATIAKEDIVDQVIVATSNCEDCGMTFFGTISLKVSGRPLMTSQKNENVLFWLIRISSSVPYKIHRKNQMITLTRGF